LAAIPLAVAFVIAVGLGLGGGVWLGSRQGGRRWIRPRGSRSEALLSSSQSRRILEGAPIGLLLLDAQLTIRSVNARAERLLDLGPGRLARGQPLSAVIDSAVVEAAIGSAMRQNRPERVEWLKV
jgi:PAS domain-containing protein